MLYNNGGLIGVRNTATTAVAKGIWSRNDQFLNKREGIWPSLVETDPYWNNVSFYGRFNNNWKDFSNNNFTVTNVTGTLGTAPTTTPAISNSIYKFGDTNSGALYVDGTGDRLSSNSSIYFGTSDFTIEMWFKPTSRTNNNPVIANNESSGWTANTWILADRHSAANTKFTFWAYNYSSSSPLLTSTTTVSNGSWYHLAIVRSGTSWKMFINGVLEASQTSSVSLDTTNKTFYIGQSGTGSNDTALNGHIDEFRISNSSRYSSNFVPQTTQFSVDANTVSLLHFDGTSGSTIFTDSSGLSWTATGNTYIDTTTSFYNQGSAYYQKGGNYLATGYSTLPSGQSAFTTGTGDYTIECWVYFPESFSGNISLISMNNSQSNPCTLTLTGYSSSTFKMAHYDGTQYTAGSQTMTLNSWNHIAGVRYNNRIYYCVNGNIQDVYATTKNHTDTTTPMLHNGPWNERFFTAYYDNIRITKGVARYTGASYTVPTGQFPTSA